jgi:hypothetical protein
MKLPTTLHLEKERTELMLIDSGAGGNFIDHDVAKELSLETKELSKPIKVKNVDGTENTKGRITHYIRLHLTICGRTCYVRFLITGLGKNRAILGLPWLIRENPIINWKEKTLRWEPPQEITIANYEPEEPDQIEDPTYEETIAVAKLCKTHPLLLH